MMRIQIGVFLLLTIFNGYISATKKAWNLDWSLEGVTDPLFQSDNGKKCFRERFEYNMNCGKYPACLTGWKSIGDGSDNTTLEESQLTIGESEYEYPMLTDSPKEIFVGKMGDEWSFPMKCASACKALRECGKDDTKTYRDPEDPINAANMYRREIKVQVPYPKEFIERFPHLEGRTRSTKKVDTLCYCYRAAKRVMRIRPKKKGRTEAPQCLNEDCKDGEKLPYYVKSCGVTRAFGKPDTFELNWFDLDAVPMNGIDKNYWKKSEGIWEREKEKFNKYA